MADIEVDTILRTFETPPQNATPAELRTASTVDIAQVELRAKDQLIGELQQQTGGKKSKGENPLNYLDVIIPLGKKFGFMQEPWVTPAVFSERPEDVPPHTTAEEVDAMFKDPKLYLQYLINALYEHVPAKYHELVADFPQFQEKFIHHLGAGRSSGVDRLKGHLDNILTMYNIDKDRKALLYHPGQDTKKPPSSYPPIFYGDLKKDAKTLMLNPIGPMSLRCMIFGASSIKNGGKAKPATNTVGYAWKLDHEGLTFGSIAFTLVVLIFLLAGADEDFQEKGKISKIPFQQYFRAYKSRLMKNADSTGIRKIKRFWTKIVFAGVATAGAIGDQGMASDDSGAVSDAEFAAAMAAISLGDEVEDDSGSEEFVGVNVPRLRNVSMEPVNTVDGENNADAPSADEPTEAQLMDVPDAPPVVTVRGQGRGRSQANSRGGARGGQVGRGGRSGRSGRGGLQTIQSDEDGEEPVNAEPQPRRSSRRA
ncbi:hypothetical protein K438DRAFT_1984582 [Mycena galopus ATCC 62051]|nr:hypothetical protein K438DRAFT_1997516 [Mycena galopus ATCC 62051]KAF8164433.1 hypothetical protein K438DRAFT_1984582 [Mycena galopus ATCC 62051]